MVVMFLDLPGVTTEQYDRLNQQMGIASAKDEPEALISHVCASTGEGLLICDVWRTREELDDFLANRLAPAAQELGFPATAPPRFAELHYKVDPR